MTEPVQTPPPTTKPPSLMQNWVSLIGMILSASSFFAVISLIGFDVATGFTSPYMGILTYLVAPAFLVTGLVLIALGAWLERQRRRALAPGAIPRLPRIDFNIRRQRNGFVIAVVVAFVFLMTTGLGTYQAYHFTESVAFCGKTCHTVMQPEYTAYQNSPHARVTCVQCHIGPGAGWFVKSKLSGTYQVYATVFNKYPQPIPTPIKNLRPAQETCEQCHWPRKFYGDAELVSYHRLPDSTSSPWTIRLLMKIGGGNPETGHVGGIHWHMNIAYTVDYIATDSARQDIPWVRITAPDGAMTVYQSETNPLTPEQVDSATIRRMDCIDCHNRPSHIYNSPSQAVNLAMSIGRISDRLPWIKKNAVALLTGDYDGTPQALGAIATSLADQYRGFPDTAVVSRTIAEVQNIYKANFFPEMKASWKVYPNNIGHLIFPGCYRCHDGKHKTADGRVVRHDCTACHLILSQGRGEEPRTISPDGLEFQHPVNIGEMWRTMSCNMCHTGA
jgi:hypothetical protein